MEGSFGAHATDDTNYGSIVRKYKVGGTLQITTGNSIKPAATVKVVESCMQVAVYTNLGALKAKNRRNIPNWENDKVAAGSGRWAYTKIGKIENLVHNKVATASL
jgi:hypothetical protein